MSTLKSYVGAMLLVCVLGLPASAYDFETPRGIGMGRTVVLSECGAAVLLQAPTYGLRRGAWYFEAGYNRRFELSELDHFSLAGAWRMGRGTVALGASQRGQADLYAEQLIKGAFWWQFDSLQIGGTISGLQLQFGNGYGELRAATFGLGAAYRHRRVLAAATADNLTSPRLDEAALASPPRYSILGEYVGGSSFAFTGRITLESAQRPRFAVAQTLDLADKGAFFWGVATGPTEYGAGIEIRIPSGSITYATSVHPVLGLSHTVTLSLGAARKMRKQSGEFD